MIMKRLGIWKFVDAKITFYGQCQCFFFKIKNLSSVTIFAESKHFTF